MPRRSLSLPLRILTSLQLTIALLTLLMILVVLCTLAQVHLGTFESVKIYFRSFFLYWHPQGVSWKIPAFPAGGAVGIVLLANLIAAHFYRLEPGWRKLGLWIIHAGLILLFVGEFVTGLFAVESDMPIDQGDTKNYTEDSREAELVIMDTTSLGYDEVYSVPEAVLSRKTRIETAKLSFSLLIKKYYRNAVIETNLSAEALSSLANRGVGPRMTVFEQPPVTADDRVNQPVAFVELVNGDRSLGTWLLSNMIAEPQPFQYMNRSYQLAMRPKRYYLPFSLTLKKFTHDVYPGTDIPKNFSSLVHLNDPARGENRDVLIYMNHPLRYGGKTFYQASFAKNDTQSIFQVVRNPGWLLPYVACVLVAFGLVLHFVMRLQGALQSG